MIKYILKRLCYAVVTLWVIATVTFVIMKSIPGDPFQNPKMPPEIRSQLMRKYGLDRPVLEQYKIYLNNIAHGDFGVSLKYKGRSVTKMIKEGFPKSFAIGWRAVLYATLLGILFGIIAALNHQKPFDYFIIFIAIIGVSVPHIVMGPFLSYTFGVNLGWLPVAVNETQASLILPSFTLGLGTLAFISRMMRTTTLEVMSQDYMQTAKAKGLAKPEIIWRHIIRNAIMPVVTVLGPLVAGIITGSIVIEQVFAVAGLGHFFVRSIFDHDYPMIMGITLFYAILIIIAMLIVDIAYGLIDPRLRVSGKGGE